MSDCSQGVCDFSLLWSRCEPWDTLLLTLADVEAEASEWHPCVFITPRRLERIRIRMVAGKWMPRSQVINNRSRDFNLMRCWANVAPCKLHDLRRSAITNWAGRLPIRIVQTLAGRANITTTRKYYPAVCPEDLRKAGQLADELTPAEGQTDTILTPSTVFD